ncbi:MAG: hypothetical protein PHQ11_15525 [Paludibacter sp.]|nr:hypothetical protein [Paludibacter sp.]
MNIFETTDPLGHKVVLTESQYENHILGDHPNERQMRELVTFFAESVLSDPEIIIKTVSEEKNIPRYNYEGNKEIKKGRIMAISVITSVSDDPEGINEVITVIPKLTMTAIMPDGSTQGGGEVIYERSAD